MAETAIRKELLEPFFLEEGIKDTNFFNGRLLTAGDLATVQQASRSRDRQLGLAVGDGVVQGLEVRLLSNGSDGKPPVLAVAKGLAFNRMGQAVALPQNVEVRLAKEKPAVSRNGKSAFEVCPPPQQQGQPLPGKGAYVLVARPAAGYQGQAPRRGFGQAAKVEGCDRDLVQEGVQFRLVAMDINLFTFLPPLVRQELADLMKKIDTASLSKLRSHLAHICLGTTERDELLRNLLPALPSQPPFEAYGAADALRAAGVLDDCDVPLALVFWTELGVQFVDRWAVRRRLTRLHYGYWNGLMGDRLAAEGEAAFLQFQDQVATLAAPTLSRPQLLAVEARQYFRYLPSVGVIPFTTGSSNRGFDYLRFFSGMTVRDPVFMEGRKVAPLLRMSFEYKPVDLASGEMLWLYLVRENRQALVDSPTQDAQPYLIFAHGHLPYMGEAMFDLSYWNFANHS